MSLIDNTSCICTKNELSLFETLPTQTAITKGKLVPIHPTTAIAGSDVIEFNITTGDREYIDLRESTLYFKMKITKADNTALNVDAGPAGQVYPINYPVATFFKHVEVLLNGKQIGSSNSLYPYRSMMEVLLNYTRDAKNHQLRAGGYYKDLDDLETTGNTITNETATNKGAIARFKMSKYNKSFELEGRIHNEMFEQGKLLLSKLPLTIKLTKANPNFALMSASNDTEYKLTIEKALFNASIKTISSSISLAHEKRLLTANAKYPVTRIEMRYFTKAAGSASLSETNLCQGEIPKRIVIGLVESTAKNGALNKNPFNFKHFNVTNVKLTVNGEEMPYNELKMNFGAEEVVSGFMTLFRGSKLWSSNNSNYITLKDYRTGYTLYVFNMAPDDAGSDAFQLSKTGNVTIDITASEATTTAISIIALFEYDSFLEIDKNRTVYYSHGYTAAT
jgi:hypothetical protein